MGTETTDLWDMQVSVVGAEMCDREVTQEYLNHCGHWSLSMFYIKPDNVVNPDLEVTELLLH